MDLLFILFAINTGEQLGVVQNFINYGKLNLPVLVDPQKQIYSAYGIHGWPSTILINQQGRVHWTCGGSKTEQLRQEIRILLGEK